MRTSHCLALVLVAACGGTAIPILPDSTPADAEAVDANLLPDADDLATDSIVSDGPDRPSDATADATTIQDASQLPDGHTPPTVDAQMAHMIDAPVVVTIDAPPPADAYQPPDAPPPPDAYQPPDAPPPPDAYQPPDARTLCDDPMTAVCDYFLPECGCDKGAGQKCSAGTTGAVCRNSGAKAEGEECAYDSECEVGTTCRTYGGSFHCLAFCDSNHGCPDGQACDTRITVSGTEIGRVCGHLCTMLEQDCKFSNQGCYPSATYAPKSDQGICLTAGTGTQGTACTSANNCAEGYACVAPSTGGLICAKLCDLGGGAPGCDSGTGTECSTLTGHENTGICLIP